MISLLVILYIVVFSSALSASETHHNTLETRYLNHPNAPDSLKLGYKSFAICVDILSRASSTKLLTNASMLVAVQQNVHSILMLLFGDYRLIDHPLEDIQAYRNKRLKAQGKSDLDEINIFNEIFIGHSSDDAQGFLIVTKAVLNGQKSALTLKYYPVGIQLPSAKLLFYKMMVYGIDLHFVFQLLLRVINSYEINFRIEFPENLNLTKVLNDLFKKFIWKSCHVRGEKIERPSPLTMKSIAKKLFNGSLNAHLYTIRQGHNGHLFTHIAGKPCTSYENKIFLGIGYIKNHINIIEEYKLPIFPSSMQDALVNDFGYCIYTYDRREDDKAKDSDSKGHKQKATASFLNTAMPLMRVPEGTIMSIYVIFPKNCLIKQLKTKQEFNSNKMGKIGENQGTSCPSSMISDVQLRAFMNRFADYIRTNAKIYLK